MLRLLLESAVVEDADDGVVGGGGVSDRRCSTAFGTAVKLVCVVVLLLLRLLRGKTTSDAEVVVLNWDRVSNSVIGGLVVISVV